VPKELDQQDPHVLHPDHHPTPFTAAEIRDASGPGRTVRQLIEVEGEAPLTRVLQWVDVDEEGATGLVYGIGPKGGRLHPKRWRSRWLELQHHASMPIETTTIDEVVLDSPMGPLDCLRYTRRDGDATDVFWFARAMPGMPVRTERVQGGHLVERVTVLANELPGKL
jgi:hypothetical protein